MHYQINDCLVKTEYAAKSTYKPNYIVLDYIKQYAVNTSALDYGCGKLRHTLPLCDYAKEVVAIDSKEQLRRIQYIAGEKTTIPDYSKKHLHNLDVYDLDDAMWKMKKYSFILCTNVLSAVPHVLDRLSILKNIRQMLTSEGVALISVQYRNSYFKTYQARENSRRYEDGWIIYANNCYSFYGLITPESLQKLCLHEDLEIIQRKLTDGSVYCLVKRR